MSELLREEWREELMEQAPAHLKLPPLVSESKPNWADDLTEWLREKMGPLREWLSQRELSDEPGFLSGLIEVLLDFGPLVFVFLLIATLACAVAIVLYRWLRHILDRPGILSRDKGFTLVDNKLLFEKIRELLRNKSYAEAARQSWLAFLKKKKIPAHLTPYEVLRRSDCPVSHMAWQLYPTMFSKESQVDLVIQFADRVQNEN